MPHDGPLRGPCTLAYTRNDPVDRIDIEVTEGLMQLPGESSPTLQAARLSGAPGSGVVGSVTVDGGGTVEQRLHRSARRLGEPWPSV